MWLASVEATTLKPCNLFILVNNLDVFRQELSALLKLGLSEWIKFITKSFRDILLGLRDVSIDQSKDGKMRKWHEALMCWTWLCDSLYSFNMFNLSQWNILKLMQWVYQSASFSIDHVILMNKNNQDQIWHWQLYTAVTPIQKAGFRPATKVFSHDFPMNPILWIQWHGSASFVSQLSDE